MAKSRRKKAIAWIVALVIVVAIVVVADRVVAGVAEDKVAKLVADKAASQKVTTERPPDVDITGFPFLTQMVAGNYSQIDMSMSKVKTKDLELSKLDLHAHDVSAALSDVMSGDGPVTADRMDAKGYISYKSLTKAVEDLVDANVSPAEDGEGNELKIAATVEVGKQPIDVEGSATVAIDQGKLTIQAHDFSAGDTTLPVGGDQILSQLASQFSTEIPIPELPYDLKLQDPKFESDAIVVSANADDVSLV